MEDKDDVTKNAFYEWLNRLNDFAEARNKIDCRFWHK